MKILSKNVIYININNASIIVYQSTLTFTNKMTLFVLFLQEISGILWFKNYGCYANINVKISKFFSFKKLLPIVWYYIYNYTQTKTPILTQITQVINKVINNLPSYQQKTIKK